MNGLERWMQKIDYFAKYIFDKMRAFCYVILNKEKYFILFKALFYDIFDIVLRKMEIWNPISFNIHLVFIFNDQSKSNKNNQCM